jgi:hypothetical protein
MNVIKTLNTLWNDLKCNTHDCYTGCTGDCNQGRNCTCQPISFSTAILEVHALASKVPDVHTGTELKLIADQLARIGNAYYERYYGTTETTVSSSEKN